MQANTCSSILQHAKHTGATQHLSHHAAQMHGCEPAPPKPLASWRTPYPVHWCSCHIMDVARRGALTKLQLNHASSYTGAVPRPKPAALVIIITHLVQWAPPYPSPAALVTLTIHPVQWAMSYPTLQHHLAQKATSHPIPAALTTLATHLVQWATPCPCLH